MYNWEEIYEKMSDREKKSFDDYVELVIPRFGILTPDKEAEIKGMAAFSIWGQGELSGH